MRRIARFTVFALLCGGVVSIGAAADAPVDFARQIQPILRANCVKCHGADRTEGKLRLDTKAKALAGGESGKVILPGHAKESLIMQRLLGIGSSAQMPKKAAPLPPAQIELIRLWIDQGADWPDAVAVSGTATNQHWAFVKPVRPAVPAVKNPGWVRNPIDNFILARLEKENLPPSPEAAKATLIRRLSFDLTGLPPTPAEVDAYVADTSADAYDKVVNRLLASPHFGERMAVYWLDLVRYADSIGYHSDNPMNVSPYRDYVITAFNENKRFDQFTIEQIAGDLLPNASITQKVASAYNRLLQTTEEGGAQAKEYEVKYLTDRIRNASTCWLGVTLGCAQCHDHKFDPFTQKDFYRFGAFFADVQEATLGRREDGIRVPTAEQAAGLAKFDETIAALKVKLDAPTPELAAAQVEWEKTQSGVVAWKILEPLSVTAAGGTKLTQQAEGVIFASGAVPAKETYTIQTKSGLQAITGVRLEIFPDPSFGAQGPGTANNGNFVLTEFKAVAGAQPVAWRSATADHSQDTFPIANAIDGKNDTGWAILPQTGKPHTAIFEPNAPLNADTLTITLDHQSGFPQHNIGKFRLAVTTSANPSGGQAMPPGVQASLALTADKRTATQQTELAAYYRTIAPLLAPLRAQLSEQSAKKAELEKMIPSCLVSTTGQPRTVRVLKRGNWQDEKGDVVEPAVPAFLQRPVPTATATATTSASANATAPARLTRLDLAHWLVSADNPLTSRTLVNRLWKLCFGTGLATPLDDLGKMGAPPLHPELLDWLAVECVASGWDVKHMMKLLVTSTTYRQTSTPSPRLRERDPNNRLYARQTPFRLDAEFVRDNALAVSGLLVDNIGGKSVFPYQPPGYWFALNFPTREWQNDKGAGLYRRGLYTHWQRTFLHPSLVAFDACTREEATAERARSNIPQQALTLLNDPTYVEAARVFAERIIKEGGATDAARLTWAFRRAVARDPSAHEVKILEHLHRKHLVEFSADPQRAAKLVSAGDAPPTKDIEAATLAAWTSVARVLLNLHETITRS